jgi:hypothetical protein
VGFLNSNKMAAQRLGLVNSRGMGEGEVFITLKFIEKAIVATVTQQLATMSRGSDILA